MSGDGMGRISEEVIDRIIQNNDIADIISEYVSLKRSGRGYMGVCPFHSDKGPSMSVSTEKQLYHCFGCGASGNAVGFIMRIRNLDFIDALKYLADRVGITIESEAVNNVTNKEKEYKNKIYQINLETARFFFKNLVNDKNAYEYLSKRGIEDRIIKKFGLGYSPKDWNQLNNYLRQKGYSDELILNAGLISKGKNGYYDKFRNRIIFPVFDVKGRVIGFGGRVTDDTKPKYLNSPETPVFTKGINLYGLNFVVKSGLPEYLVVVEGYMDCIALHQNGISNTVASLGTALTLEQAKLLKRYSKDILICYDSDAAGQTATLRGLDILASVGCNVKVITIPKGKDPDEFIKIYGVEEFKLLIERAISVTDYRILRAREDIDLRNPTQRIQFANRVAQILGEIENEIEIQGYASKVADQTGIDIKSVLNEIKKIKDSKINKENNKTIIRNNIYGNNYNMELAYKKAEKFLLHFSIMGSDYFNYIKDKINMDDFITEVYKKAASIIYSKLEKGENIVPNDILIKFESHQEISEVSQIFEGEEIADDVYQLIEDYIRTLKKFNIENKINNLTVQIKKCEESNEIAKSAALFQDLIALQKQLSLI
jgi:DNA primase